MLAFATLLAAMLSAALSDSCAVNPSSRVHFAAGQVQFVPSGQAGVWVPPVEIASAAMACDAESGQFALLGVDARQRGYLWVLRPESDGWSVLREMDGLPAVEAAAIAEGRLILGVVRRGVSELWLMPSYGKSRPDVRQLGAPATAIALSGDRSTWWVATGTELRGFGRDDGATRESFVFPAQVLGIASVPGSEFVAVAWDGTLVLVDPHDRPARGVLPWRAQSSVPGTVTKVAMSPAGDAMNVRLTIRGSDQELALVLRPSAAPPPPAAPPPAPVAPPGIRRADPVPLTTPEPVPAPPVAPDSRAGPDAAASPVTIEPLPKPAAPDQPVQARSEKTPPQPPASPPTTPPAGGAPECKPDTGEFGVIAGRIDDPEGLAAELIVHGPDNVLQEATRLSLQRSLDGACFRVAGLKPGRYRLQVMGRGGASLRTRPPFLILDFAPDRHFPVHFTVDGRM